MRIKKEFLKRYWFILLIFFLLSLNLIWAIFTYQTAKKRESVSLQRYDQLKSSYTADDSFIYDSIAPDFTVSSWEGEKITLSNFLGNVVILRFSRFNISDLPYLLYLEHLAKRLKDEGVSLFFINTLGKYESEAIKKVVSLSSPIIEDDGAISSLYNTSPYEIIIIGRDFRLKLKQSQLDNRIIYNQVIRFAFENRVPHLSPSADELTKVIKKITYRDVMDKKIKNLGDEINKNGAIVTLFISTCLNCPEQSKIKLMKQVSEKSRYKTIFLFGLGNGIDILNEFSISAALNKYPITVGLIENQGSVTQEEYIKLFKYDVNPRIMIFSNQGSPIYLEEVADERIMNADFILNKIK